MWKKAVEKEEIIMPPPALIEKALRAKQEYE